MSNNDKIKVLIVDDSVLVRKYLSQILSELNMEIVGTAPNGKIGLQKMYLFKPDIIILDIEMPEMNGIEFLKNLKNQDYSNIKPYVIMFSSIAGNDSLSTLEALSLGAVDFIKKPEGQIYDNMEKLKKEFEIKIIELFKEKKERILLKQEFDYNKLFEEKNKEDLKDDYQNVLYGLDKLQLIIKKKRIKPELIAIGSSTGGPNAIRKILEVLKPLPIPMIIAQHMPSGFTLDFARNLENIFKRRVKEISNNEILENGTIYICPGGYHARVFNNNSKLIFKIDEKQYEGFFFKPSVDIFFKSINESIGNKVVAVILSGMGKDGSIEIVNLRKNGAITIAQNKESSVVWGMPGNSVKNGGIDLVLDISEIGLALNEIIEKLC